jgi:hypothetical protein
VSWDVGAGPRRDRRRAVLRGVAVTALLGCAVALGLHAAARRLHPAGAPTTEPVRQAAPPAAPRGEAAVAGAAPLRLPAPRTAAGSHLVPLGFPRTALGAASAAWRWTSVMYGLDPAAASVAATAYADPSFPDAPARAAQAVLAARASLGVAAAGPASPAYLVVTPRMLRITDPAPDSPVIDVLATTDLGSAAGARLHQVRVIELHLRWEPGAAGGGDYRLLDRDMNAARVVGLAADPDSTAARRLGWRDVVLAETPR